MISGRATTEGTERYRDKFIDSMPAHFGSFLGWFVSSIGLGTYLGEHDEDTDRAYEESVLHSLASGCNLIDTAINYRYQRSERSVGAALRQAMERGVVSREEVILCTKGGFLTFDGDHPSDPSAYIHQQFIASGICKPDEIVAGCHCMSPSYLENQLDQSLTNLGVDCVDVYFIHNPETQLSTVSRDLFLERMLQAFRLLEAMVDQGKLQVYGTATWNGFRERPGTRPYLSLSELLQLAREAGGDGHHFRALQLPYNLAMPEAYFMRNQKADNTDMSLIELAARNEMLITCSASILQKQLASNLPDLVRQIFKNLRTDAQRSIQFVRSTPGVSSALVGMSRVSHVRENLEVATFPKTDWSTFKELFTG